MSTSDKKPKMSIEDAVNKFKEIFKFSEKQEKPAETEKKDEKPEEKKEEKVELAEGAAAPGAEGKEKQEEGKPKEEGAAPSVEDQVKALEAKIGELTARIETCEKNFAEKEVAMKKREESLSAAFADVVEAVQHQLSEGSDAPVQKPSGFKKVVNNDKRALYFGALSNQTENT